MTKRGSSILLSPGRILSVLAATFAVFYLVALIGVTVQGYRVQKQVDALEKEVEDLKKEREQLLAQLDHVKSDIYVEKVAREELKWGRPGEKVFVPVPEGEPTLAPQRATPVPASPLSTIRSSHWPEWKELFFGPRKP